MNGSLVALDVDGTLLGRDGSITPRTIEAVEAVARAGAVVALATGRDWHAVTGLLEQLPSVSYSICINGIEIFDRHGVELWAGALDHEAATRAVDVLRAAIPGLAVGAGINGDLVGEADLHAAMPPGLAETIIVDDIVHHLRPGLRDLVLYHPELSHDLDRFYDSVVALLDGHHELQVAYTGLPMIELTPPGAGKHAGLAWLADHLGIDRSAVIAIGDGRNDITMLEWAGIGVAMGQAPERCPWSRQRGDAARERGRPCPLARAGTGASLS